MKGSDIHKVGLLAIREGRILLCRKIRDTSLLILPGGKIEDGETHEQCLLREVAEELGEVALHQIAYVGTYGDQAAGSNKRVQIELYAAELRGEPRAQAEIGELVWFGAGDDGALLSPVLRNHILPDLIARGILAPATESSLS